MLVKSFSQVVSYAYWLVENSSSAYRMSPFLRSMRAFVDLAAPKSGVVTSISCFSIFLPLMTLSSARARCPKVISEFFFQMHDVLSLFIASLCLDNPER